MNKFILSAGLWGYLFASYLKDKLPELTSAVAVCGTAIPVDDELGIPHKSFELSLIHAEKGLQGKFTRNVFVEDDLLARYEKTPVERSIENRVNELVNLMNLSNHINLSSARFTLKLWSA